MDVGAGKIITKAPVVYQSLSHQVPLKKLMCESDIVAGEHYIILAIH